MITLQEDVGQQVVLITHTRQRGAGVERVQQVNFCTSPGFPPLTEPVNNPVNQMKPSTDYSLMSYNVFPEIPKSELTTDHYYYICESVSLC